MTERVETKPLGIAELRGKIRRQLISRMQEGEVLVVRDFEGLLDLGVGVEALHRLTPTTGVQIYGSETLFYDRTVEADKLRFDETKSRIDAEENRLKVATFNWGFERHLEG